ncbi:hypothetical protein V8B97DRAFT_751060 [Scleroderma yunnanense]
MNILGPVLRKFLRWLLTLLTRKIPRLLAYLIKYLFRLRDMYLSCHDVNSSSRRNSASTQPPANPPHVDLPNQSEQTGVVFHVDSPVPPKLNPALDLGHRAHHIASSSRSPGAPASRGTGTTNGLRISVHETPITSSVNDPRQGHTASYVESPIAAAPPMGSSTLLKDFDIEFMPFGATEVDRYNQKVLMYVVLVRVIIACG